MTPPYTPAMRRVALVLLVAATTAAALPSTALPSTASPSIARPSTASPSTILAAGLAAYAAHDFATARHDFVALADDGSAIAETMLGAMSAHGQGVRRDPAAAAAYYCRAAHRGYAPAQLAFARALLRGDGVGLDRQAAWLWLRLAAARGDARVVASARAEATALAAAAPPPADTSADWRPWPSAGE